MRKSIVGLLLLFILSACSSGTLEEAIINSGYNHDQPEILYQNDNDGIVIFLTKKSEAEYVIVKSTFEKSFFNRFQVNTDHDYSVPVDISSRYEFISMDLIKDSSNDPKHLIWGGVFRYPGAERVNYSLISKEGKELYQSSVEINSKHVFVDILGDETFVTEVESLSYQVLDSNDNVLVTQ